MLGLNSFSDRKHSRFHPVETQTLWVTCPFHSINSPRPHPHSHSALKEAWSHRFGYRQQNSIVFSPKPTNSGQHRCAHWRNALKSRQEATVSPALGLRLASSFSEPRAARSPSEMSPGGVPASAHRGRPIYSEKCCDYSWALLCQKLSSLLLTIATAGPKPPLSTEKAYERTENSLF